MIEPTLKKRITLALLALSFCVLSGFTAKHFFLRAKAETLIEAPVSNIEYGIETNNYFMVREVIKPNENLSTILLRNHIPLSTIDRLMKESAKVFDLSKMTAGNPYTVFCTKDSAKVARCFIYEDNPAEYYVFDMRDTLGVYKGEKLVEVKEQLSSGVINSSLYAEMESNSINPLLAIELSEVYAWTINFFKIQKGDSFKVIYDEKFVDGKSIGVGRVKASYFFHAGKGFYAFYFDENGKGSYFDENAESMKRAFLKAPLKFSRMTSGFTLKRFHPVLKINKPHLGTDFAAPTGTPIMTVGDGVVLDAKFGVFNGNYVKIKHNGTYTTQYLHMSKIAKGMHPGAHVNQGDIIGYVGSTGLATGPHVCFRFWKNGEQVDPRKEKSVGGFPVEKKYQERFRNTMNGMKKRLDGVNANAV